MRVLSVVVGAVAEDNKVEGRARKREREIVREWDEQEEEERVGGVRRG